jgi:hypothetical protein
LFIARDHLRGQLALLDEQLQELGYGSAGRS